ncbi:MAG TPA: AI-2E family transporter [Saprospiraceae bacterium]|nr:AI-2E family transporter [Saprospiraceae bacterium]
MVKNQYDSFVQISLILVGILAFGFILYIGRDIILPLILSLILAILINPIVYVFEKWKWNRVLAIFLAVMLTFLLICGIVYFISSQFANLSDALPQLEDRLNTLTSQGVQWLSETFHFNAKNINKWIEKLKVENLGDGSFLIGETLSTITGILFYVLLIPVYMFLFLYYKPLFLEFFAQLFPADEHATVVEVLQASKKLIQSYLVGLCVEAGIVALLNSTALLIIGIEYAILIGIIGAFLNVIPYIGGVISFAIPMILAIVTKEPVYALWVFLAYSVIQFFDNNFLMPKIVASKVRVNALIAIVVVFIGGALWGIPGMFLSLPLTAIIKVILDHIVDLKPWGFLIGDTMPSIHATIFGKRRKKSSSS